MSTEVTNAGRTADVPPDVVIAIERLLDAGAPAGEGGAGAVAPDGASAVTVSGRPAPEGPAPLSLAADEAPAPDVVASLPAGAEDESEAPQPSPPSLPASPPLEEPLPDFRPVLPTSWPFVHGFGREAAARAHCTFVRGAETDEVV